MRIGLTLLVALCVSCASPAPKPTAAAAGEAARPASVTPTAVIVTIDPHAVMGCRLITRTVQGYDIPQPDEWRKLQEETARRGGDTALVSLEGDRKAEIFSCSKP